MRMRLWNGGAPPTLSIALLTMILVFGVACDSDESAPTFVIPVPSVTKSVDQESIFPGEPFRVSITVTGEEAIQIEQVPNAVVFVLDESGSMAADNRFEFSRDAADSVASLLTEGTDKAALIVFSDEADVLVSLTSQISDIGTALDGIPSPPTGLTNMSDAFEKALLELNGDPTPNKSIILFTDGQPCGTINCLDTVDQINEMQVLADEAISAGVQVFPVTLDAEQAWLANIAEDTFGTYTNATNVSELTAKFEAAYEEVSNVLSTKNITIIETLAPEFEYIPDSLNYSFSGPSESSEFAAAVAISESNFESTNSITLPEIAILPKDRIFAFSFLAASRDCLTPHSDVESILLDVENLPTSIVEYTSGGPDVHIVGIPQEDITCKRPGDLIVDKSFNEISSVVRLGLTNSYTDRSVTDIDIFEALTFDFEPLLLTANPPLDGAPITTSTTPHRRWLFWHVDELAPEESREFSFQVRVLACSPDTSPPLEVNFTEFPALEANPSFRPHINYAVPTGLVPSIDTERRVISHLEDPDFELRTTEFFSLPACPTEPGSLADTTSLGGGFLSPEDVLGMP